MLKHTLLLFNNINMLLMQQLLEQLNSPNKTTVMLN